MVIWCWAVAGFAEASRPRQYRGAWAFECIPAGLTNGRASSAGDQYFSGCGDGRSHRAHVNCGQVIAACANIIPAVHSIYRWKDKIETAGEAFVFFKTTQDQQAAFQEKLRALHPYDVPEIIFIPVVTGLPDYLRWVIESC